MALYLGNQKVSLRSGQDPTFDYGFDSNGRLVFANKNATEINNFLNYDSSYSEILDLSNLSKMEKVAVNGTADRKMGGLKGLLVSPNAPFTGSSPQINASYTGLNKSALVSLFESVPYNVGYTKVGNPTIVDGVASGFSNSDYFTLPGSVSKAQEFEIVGGINLNTSNPSGAYSPIFQSIGYGVIFCVTADMKLGAYLSSTGNSWDLANITTFVGTTTLSANTNYLAKLKKTSTAYELWLKQGNNDWNLEATLNSMKTLISGNLRIGYGSRAFEGSIDLNETYIKINGVPWFGPGATKNLVPDGTVVGDVIVKDGIASGFSLADFIRTSQRISPISGDFEIHSKFNSSNVASSSNQCIVSLDSQIYIYLTGNGKLYARTQYNNTWSTSILTGVLSNNTDYEFTFKRESGTYTLIINNQTVGTSEDSNPVGLGDLFFSFGNAKVLSPSDIFTTGSIDLNNTYIKVGSDYFYRGMVPMTKTCSIVGATGTADLTQEDKNIILNKGWSLTVQ